MIDNLTEAISHAREVAKNWESQLVNCVSEEGRKMCKERAEDSEKIAAWLEELAERREADRWIPITERLPNTLGVYNVTRKLKEGETVYFISSASYFDGQDTWYHDTGINHERPYLTDITAWRPLPESYEGEEVKRTCSRCGWCQTSDNPEDPEDTLVCANGACENCGRFLGTLEDPIEIEDCKGFDEPV